MYGTAQPKVVTWYFDTAVGHKNEAVITFTAVMDEGWHIYSPFMNEGGPMPTKFTIKPSKEFSLICAMKEESIPVKNMDATFDMEVVWFEKTAVFTQRIKLIEPVAKVTGTVTFMACRDGLCLMPQQTKFELNVMAAN
jgi:thiol:disulfide interchange protein DsbD